MKGLGFRDLGCIKLRDIGVQNLGFRDLGLRDIGQMGVKNFGFREIQSLVFLGGVFLGTLL